MFDRVLYYADVPASVAVAGGLLLLARNGSPSLSLERVFSGRQETVQ